VHQLRPLVAGQPWGIFFIEFDKKRLPVVVLRRILSHLVIKKRGSSSRAERAAWNAGDLLFISAFGNVATDDREIAFAHFHQESGDLPTLHVLGWDGGNTSLTLASIEETLKARLCWPKDSSDAEAWRKQWSGAFRHRIGHIIRTATKLAEVLASLASGIRDRAKTMLAAENERGPLTKLFRAFQTALLHDLTPETFADTYAQSITYGLLTAAFSRPETAHHTNGVTLVADNVTDNVPVTNPFLKEMLETFLKVGGRKVGIDFDELGIQDVVELLRSDETDLPAIIKDFGNKNSDKDPVVYFYEHFLSAYDKQLKIQRGVFYTPRPVVSYIVRSVHELLQTEFGLIDGLADTATWSDVAKRHKGLKIPADTNPESPFVQILDPATGTATFLVEVIDVIHRTLAAKWTRQGRSKSQQQAAWNEYVPQYLLPRLHGYELMMAPYAVAHMKIGLKLYETGYRFASDERVRVYLTNTLDPPSDDKRQREFEQWVPALAHEAQAVNAIKRSQRFTIVIGNPPYAGISANMSQTAQRLVDAYKFVDGAPLNERKLWLQDDYVKFIRTAQTTILQARTGILGYITNHGYLDNPTFRGMRQSLMNTFQCVRVLDLHGNANKMERSPDGSEDKNVFDIRQGVAICLASRGGTEVAVRHAGLWGSREEKYAWLGRHSVGDTSFMRLAPDSPYYFFEPQNTDCRDEYDRGWKINEFMPVNSAGFITARDHFVVDFDRDELLSRIADFVDPKLSDEQIRSKYFAGCGSDKYPDGDTRGWKVPQARKRIQADRVWRERVATCFYRPFDRRVIYWADWMVDWPRPEVMGHMLAGPNLAFHVCRQSVSEQWAHVLVTTSIVDDCYVSNKTRERGYTHPLYLYPTAGGLGLSGKREANFKPAFLQALRESLKTAAQKNSLPQGLTPEDIFHYAYAVFHSPGYRCRYAEFLKIDFPRLPLTGNMELFRSDCAMLLQLQERLSRNRSFPFPPRYCRPTCF